MRPCCWAHLLFLCVQFYSPGSEETIFSALGWFTTGFFIFNVYMTVCALQKPAAVFVVFFLLGMTELLVFIGEFKLQPDGQPGSVTMAGGYFGFFTAVAGERALLAPCLPCTCAVTSCHLFLAFLSCCLLPGSGLGLARGMRRVYLPCCTLIHA